MEHPKVFDNITDVTIVHGQFYQSTRFKDSLPMKYSIWQDYCFAFISCLFF